ncbi:MULTISPECIES: hypothetical protein [Sphingobium]|jgi:hypothetical protein|uniref:hypothetical protein n=1 Tax=Sphingobium TaxID=165695 RepID=UPI0024324091|nr:hypothetical protein [Sphingobium yanoikuyae]
MDDFSICAIETCGKVRWKRQWCSAHYQRWLAHGDPLSGRTPKGEPLAFLENTVISYHGKDCLIWPYVKRSGYGIVTYKGEKRLVTRVVCEAEHGPPPTPVHEASHLCGKGHLGCCNPKHLAWKTPKENNADKLTHGTHHRGEQSPRAKLTVAQVLEIRSSTKPHPELGKAYGVSRQLITDIKAGRRWSWLK